jgi:hypothetical protein
MLAPPTFSAVRPCASGMECRNRSRQLVLIVGLQRFTDLNARGAILDDDAPERVEINDIDEERVGLAQFLVGHVQWLSITRLIVADPEASLVHWRSPSPQIEQRAPIQVDRGARAPMHALCHARGDWGELCAEDHDATVWALTHGARLLSNYPLPTGQRIWIITEADRSATTLLLPEEY